ncbi:uncharacterized protein TRUGW13939_00057 [Talaromyces rugulosus]|uniref:F-box domain-containing protein n=1 Tax=Talaromyces rugulosus TaxID=121627 RepID=A0A7H8QGF4_TALRU|nr:uncharacterized protein TRUGW13939_00057 [Talaromyces rugulosus]QKX52986.1 hypothetical protein TRUGW13939_00057 [Talaromyces rugulosus]
MDTSTDWLAQLPLEIISMILSQLSIHSLVSFGATSRNNFRYHILGVKRLHLAVFNRPLDAHIAFMDRGLSNDSKTSDDLSQVHQIQVVLPGSSTQFDVPLRDYFEKNSGTKRGKQKYAALMSDKQFGDLLSVEQTIRAQNEKFSQMVYRYGASLMELEFLAHDLSNEGAMALGASCGSKLRHLGLRFQHPHVRDGCLISGRYWANPAPASSAWNYLIGIGPGAKEISMSNLESLVLERAGITPWQLRMLIKRNRTLEVLKLRTCAAVKPEFVNWLGGMGIPDYEGEIPRQEGEPAPGASLKILWLENCNGIYSKNKKFHGKSQDVDSGLDWVRGLVGLQSLSFRECKNIDANAVQRANEAIWHIPELHAPRIASLSDSLIEVDPEYA